jgi:hypothetical protein
MILLVATLLATGCSGGDDAGVASMEGSTTTEQGNAPETGDFVLDEEAVLGFAACMREEGIDFPDPVVDRDGNVGFDLLTLRKLGQVDEDELDAAFEGCASYLEGVQFGFEQLFNAEFQDQLVAFSACMRDNGFDMPDPDFSGLEENGRLYPPFDLDDPDFDAAFDACRDVLPGIPGIANPGR